MKDILFDLYGTLIDIHTNEKNPKFWSSLKESFYPNNKMTSKELKNMYLNLCQKLAIKKEEIEILDVFSKLPKSHLSVNEMALKFRELSTIYISLYDGVIDLLNDLKKLGYKLYVLSNAQSAFTIPELKKLEIYDLFDGILISSDYGIKKPNIDFFKVGINKYNIKDGIMIGNDYNCDIKPAKSLNLDTIFIYSNLTNSYKTKADLIGFNKDIILNKILDYSKNI